MTDSVPLVSIMVPAYNQQDYIEESLRSCLNQSWSSLEVVVSDDCSSDRTWQIIQQLREEFPDRLIAHRNQRNLGASANCNTLLQKMTGKYVAFFAGDDLMYPDKIRRQVQYLEENPRVAIVAHDLHFVIAGSATPTGRWFESSPVLSGGVELFFRHQCFVGGCSLMVRREWIPQNGFHESLIASDWLMFVEILLNSGLEIHTMPDVLGAYRRRRGQLTSKSPRGLSLTLDHAFACGWLAANYPQHRDAIASSQRRWREILVQELSDSAIWEKGIGQSHLDSPRWLAKRLIGTIKSRVFRQ